MTRSQGPLKLDNPWVWIGWLSVAGLLTVAALLALWCLAANSRMDRSSAR